MSPAERLNHFIADGRVVRGKMNGLWRGIDEQGKQIATLLAAFDDSIESPNEFSTEIMPAWMAHFTIHANEFGTSEAWPKIVQRYGQAALHWQILDSSAWRRCLADTMTIALRLAKENDRSGCAYRVHSMWMRAAVNDEPNDSEWAQAVEWSWDAWASIAKVNAERGTLAAQTAEFISIHPPEGRPAWAAMRAAQQGLSFASQNEATMVISLAIEAWNNTQPEAAKFEQAQTSSDVGMASRMQRGWDIVTQHCLASIEREIVKARVAQI